MFEISWSELLILAVVTLIFVGPKDLPKFLNTLGRYAGMVRRQAAEFRAQFDEAMRQAELDALKKEVEDVRSGIQDAVRETQVPQQPATPTSGSAYAGATGRRASAGGRAIAGDAAARPHGRRGEAECGRSY